MVDHDLSLEADRMVIAFDVSAELLGSTLGVELRVGLDSLYQAVIAIDGCVVA
jgi:hypothetical protein